MMLSNFVHVLFHGLRVNRTKISRNSGSGLWSREFIVGLIAVTTFLVISPLSHGGSHSAASHGPGVPQPKPILHLGQPPKPPTLVSPTALSVVSGKNVELQWTPEPEAFTYHVQVAKDPMFKWIIHENHDVKENRYTLSNLPNGTIFWRVFSQKPQNQAGLWKSRGTWSSFEVRAE
ncbi:MAG: fibronectin type III domain-containing protein [Bdellovibrionaceae bacterium]|nr:fibronectin type III domain-containing protein [Pseudobdellovibrionaceae bacterium]